MATQRGIEIHVGHGLTYDTVRPVAAIPEVRELNIGHFIMGEALFVGLDAAVRRMRHEIDIARGQRMIIGIGQDMCDIRRIEKSIAEFGDRFTNRVFTEVERTHR